MRVLICLVILLVLPTVGQAQETSDPKAWTERFLGTLVNDGPSEAHKLLLNDTALGEIRPDAIRGFRENMQKSEEIHGKAIGYEILTEKKLGDSILVFIAVVKRRQTPIFWRHVFYRYRSNWNLVNFGILAKVEQLDSLWLL